MTKYPPGNHLGKRNEGQHPQAGNAHRHQRSKYPATLTPNAHRPNARPASPPRPTPNAQPTVQTNAHVCQPTPTPARTPKAT